MQKNMILPFYMTYPYPMVYQEEDRMIRDLEYMQQLYPKEARSILRRVIRKLDPMDYPNSILYDEFPDQIGIYRIAAAILKEIEEEKKAQGETQTDETRLWMADLVKVILYQEIFKRRYERKNGYLRF